MLNIVSSSRYKINRAIVKNTIDSLLKQNDLSSSLVNVIFVGRKKMKSISAKYKHENLALPVLSFPYINSPHGVDNLLGEIFICYPQAVLLAAERDKKVDYIIEYLIKHGLENILK